ncbi:MAG: FHA domain-containing protein [Anaerolineaceae bacterium]|nr:FHA domain-containing protein [Anaerolineaceae bacterium]
MAETKPQIVMRSGPIPGSSYYLDKPEVSVGRDKSNDIPVPDAEISRRHARFIVKPDGVYIEDLGSTNGTFLNGVRLSAPKRLVNGDLVTLAESTVMSFEWEGALEAAAYTPTYGTPAPQPETIAPKPEPVYEAVEPPVPQRPLARESSPEPKPRKPWYMNFLVILLIIVIIIGLVLTFMPASWWCFLSFNRLPGCY